MTAARGLPRPRGGQAPRGWRATPRVLVLFGLAALVVVGLVLFLDSAFFAVREVTVVGLDRIPDREILALSGIRGGVSTWRLSLKAIERGVESHPRVLRATVVRDLPCGIRVTVEERKAVAVVPYYAAFLEVDGEGRVLGLAGGPPLVPVITGVILQRAVPGDDLSARLRPALEVVIHLGGEGLLAEVHLEEGGEVVAYTADAVRVYLGRPQAMEAKLAALRALVEELAATGARAEYIDLRNVGRPLVKLHDRK